MFIFSEDSPAGKLQSGLMMMMMMDDDLSVQRVRPWVCVSVLCVYFFKLCKILKADFFPPSLAHVHEVIPLILCSARLLKQKKREVQTHKKCPG